MAGSLALAVTLHGVDLADASDIDLARLETRTPRPYGGGQRGQGGGLLSPVTGHRTSPGNRAKYDKLAWLARVARAPGAA